MALPKAIARILHRPPRTEADVPGDHARADSRAQGGGTGRLTEGGTTGTSPNGTFVGRVSGDDHFAGDTGAEVRSRRHPEPEQT